MIRPGKLQIPAVQKKSAAHIGMANMEIFRSRPFFETTLNDAVNHHGAKQNRQPGQ